MSPVDSELVRLLDALCDNRITPEEIARLEGMVLADQESLRHYLRYIELHGMLHWDVAGGAAVLTDNAALPASDRVALAESVPVFSQGESEQSSVAGPWRRRLRTRSGQMLTTAALAVVVLCGWFSVQTLQTPSGSTIERPLAQSEGPPTSVDRTEPVPPTPLPGRSIRLSHQDRDAASGGNPGLKEGSTSPAGVGGGAAIVDVAPVELSPQSLTAVINRELEAHWAEHGVTPSPPADDAEWVRRVYLDLLGRIPTVDEARALQSRQKSGWRAALVDRLLASPEFARHSSVLWTNLLIGHTSPRDVNRPALEKFLREQFHHNRPWSETVTRLIAAEGYEDEDGATNFLLAHVNNEAVPATAITSRVLLCEQVQCTQCHNHPTGPWTQDRFWELNSFFQQTEIVRHRQVDPRTGRALPDRLELVNLDVGGPTFFEDQQARMKVAYPQFAGLSVDPAAHVDRRVELARLLCSGDTPQMARAFVNRQWARLLHYGFTNPVDDMGPHAVVQMPKLLDHLTREFVHSGYDVKHLLRAIVLSDAYQLGSVITEGNRMDDPERGQPPLFSRMYVRSMTAAQVFDSLIVATRADLVGVQGWDDVEQRRRHWLEQFYQALDNDENSEEGAFDGSLSQALVMMNGELVQKATDPRPGTVLHQILADSPSDEERIRRLSLATLSRLPTEEELGSLRRVVRQQIQIASRDVPMPTAVQMVYRDLMWAFLNSSEFRSIH